MNNDTILLMDSLKEKSLQLYSGMVVVDTHIGKEYTINIPALLPKLFKDCFTTDASNVFFVLDNKVYVTPSTSHVIRALLSAGFSEEYFSIPFEYCFCPKNKKEKVKWETLCQEASYEYENPVEFLF